MRWMSISSWVGKAVAPAITVRLPRSISAPHRFPLQATKHGSMKALVSRYFAAANIQMMMVIAMAVALVPDYENDHVYACLQWGWLAKFCLLQISVTYCNCATFSAAFEAALQPHHTNLLSRLGHTHAACVQGFSQYGKRWHYLCLPLKLLSFQRGAPVSSMSMRSFSSSSVTKLGMRYSPLNVA